MYVQYDSDETWVINPEILIKIIFYVGTEQKCGLITVSLDYTWK